MKCLRVFQTGDPLSALRLDEEKLPDPKPGQVLVRMISAPVNPADINTLEGTYGEKRDLPFIPGNEGVGRIEKTGIATAGLKPGQLVIFPGRRGSWCEAFLAEPQELLAIPPGVPEDQAAMMTVNPSTALRLLTDFVTLKPGDWVIQNAANSSVGRYVIQLARHRRLRTINLVRRPQLAEELTALGADVVIAPAPGSRTRAIVREATGGAPVKLGLNATSGALLGELLKGLSADATVVTYGGMSREPFQAGVGQFIFSNLTAKGLWMSRWIKQASSADVAAMFNEIGGLIKTGVLHVPIEAAYRLDQYLEAVAHAMREGRTGKIVFRMD